MFDNGDLIYWSEGNSDYVYYFIGYDARGWLVCEATWFPYRGTLSALPPWCDYAKVEDA